MNDINKLPYCVSRFSARRRSSRVVPVGTIGIGGDNPLRIQSMTTTQTLDIAATVRQTIALAEVGCDIVRITAPNKAAAEALGEISRQVRAAGWQTPLVADIHFLPQAAMEAAKHVEKVRINPGNYADKKKFKILEYTDQAYNEELERLYDAFTPIVLRCKELGRAMRIGTNHGSLSDRIMNRYGDSPLGMVESALEFIRIAENHGYRDIVLSMKASNPKVMIAAYRLAAARMAQEGMDYPLHLGVTEAGDGEDARVKSSIGIGALLYDGLGDTIRVSLTEDPVYEVPVARDLANKAEALWRANSGRSMDPVRIDDGVDPYSYARRFSQAVSLGKQLAVGAESLPSVWVKTHQPIANYGAIIQSICAYQMRYRDAPLEGLVVPIEQLNESVVKDLQALYEGLETVLPALAIDLGDGIDIADLEAVEWREGLARWVWMQRIGKEDALYAMELLRFSQSKGVRLILDVDADRFAAELAGLLAAGSVDGLMLAAHAGEDTHHPLAAYRKVAESARAVGLQVPLWIRNTTGNTIDLEAIFSDYLMEASMLSGALLCDGLGDGISIETEPLLDKATLLGYTILQGARARISRTEFVACPSCGRTLFDLQEVTQKIRSRTDHLKGVTIAIMGCIVNGPGEMADADFGYVGGSPGRINLYVGKECVKYNVPAAEALDRLIDIIREHGKWIEPPFTP
jgi:(E)-4-hydroxy-3-methylbut-2-enyl-diphosphate synthase